MKKTACFLLASCIAVCLQAQVLPQAFKGNWFSTDGQDTWRCGFYDSLAILNNDFYRYTDIRKKRNKTLLTLNNEEGRSLQLTLSLRKDSTLQLADSRGGCETLSRTPLFRTGTIPTDTAKFDEDTFFRTDTAVVQGFIDGYGPQAGFTSFMLQLEDHFLPSGMDQRPVLAEVKPDGRFRAEIPLTHPVMGMTIIHDESMVPFYVEPGDTITLYLDWGRRTQYEWNLQRGNLMAMGRNARTLTDFTSFDLLNLSGSTTLMQEAQTMSPEEFLPKQLEWLTSKLHELDSAFAVHPVTPKAASLLRNYVRLNAGSTLLNLVGPQNLRFPQNKASYYRFLHEMPTDDIASLANLAFGAFINALEFSELGPGLPPKMICFPPPSLLSVMQGMNIQPDIVDLPALQDMDRKTGHPILWTWAESLDSQAFEQKYPEAYKAWTERTSAYRTTSQDLRPEGFEQMALHALVQLYREKDSLMTAYCGQRHSFVNKLMWTRNCNKYLPILENRETALRFGVLLTQDIDRPLSLTRLVFDEIERIHPSRPQTADTAYELPDSKDADVFRRLIAPCKGKYVLVDCWASWCGPCRQGIEASAEIREKYADSPDIDFVFVTGDSDTPQPFYDDFTNKHLQGELSYRIPQDDFNRLMRLFRFTSIPRYILVDRQGCIIDDNHNGYDGLEHALKALKQKEQR